MDLGNTQVTLTCPGCGHKFKQPLAGLENDATVNCPGCKKPITVNAAPFRASIKKVDQRIADLKRAIGRIGKR